MKFRVYHVCGDFTGNLLEIDHYVRREFGEHLQDTTTKDLLLNMEIDDTHIFNSFEITRIG